MEIEFLTEEKIKIMPYCVILNCLSKIENSFSKFF